MKLKYILFSINSKFDLKNCINFFSLNMLLTNFSIKIKNNASNILVDNLLTTIILPERSL